jgi:glutamine synthetase
MDVAEMAAEVFPIQHCTGTPWSQCPRAALRKALTSLTAEYGLRMHVGWAIEFVLLHPPPQAHKLPEDGLTWEEVCVCLRVDTREGLMS